MGIKFKTFLLLLALIVPSPYIFSQKKMDAFEIIALRNRAIGHVKEEKYVESLNEFKQLYPYMPSLAGFFLGEQYFYGQGTDINIFEAIKYYTQSGEDGHPISQQKLGVYYDKEKEQNPDLAYYWNRKAAKNPLGVDCHDAGPCMFNLATYYLQGIGTSKNKLLAELWIFLSAILEYGAAEDYLDENYNIDSDWNTDEEELQYNKLVFEQFFILLTPYLSEETIEALSIKSYYYLLKGDLPSFAMVAKKLYDMPDLRKEGKKLIGESLVSYYRGYKNDKYNAEIIENDIQNLGKIDEDLYNIWFYQQFVIAIGKLDEQLAKTNFQ